MKKRVLMIAAVVSGALAISGCTTNPYTGEREAGKSGIGAGIGSLVGAGVGVLSSSKHDRGKGALIGAAAGAALGAAYLAGLAVGFWQNLDELQEKAVIEREFRPGIETTERNFRYSGWKKAVKRALAWEEHEE